MSGLGRPDAANMAQKPSSNPGRLAAEYVTINLGLCLANWQM